MDPSMLNNDQLKKAHYVTLELLRLVNAGARRYKPENQNNISRMFGVSDLPGPLAYRKTMAMLDKNLSTLEGPIELFNDTFEDPSTVAVGIARLLGIRGLPLQKGEFYTGSATRPTKRRAHVFYDHFALEKSKHAMATLRRNDSQSYDLMFPFACSLVVRYAPDDPVYI